MRNNDYKERDYHPLMYSILKKYHLYDKKDDYLDICYIGYAKALNKYDKTKTRFTTYAYKCIENELLCELRKERAHKRQREECSLENLYSDNIYFNADLSDETPLVVQLISEDTKHALNGALDALNEVENEVIKKLFGIECVEMTQNQVAEEFNISQSQVSLIKTKALAKLKEILNNER